MIERLRLKNFQRHDKLDVELSPGITAITGPSDVGKSSILRSIRWVAFNRPLGTGFVRHGESVCQAGVRVDGKSIIRRRDKKQNIYKIDGIPLNAVGTDVPEEIDNLLNLGPENFQGQHDPPFWFSLTGGELARELNRIVDLSVIDRSASWLASQVRQVKAEEKVCGERLQEAEKRLSGLAWVPEMSEGMNQLEDAQKAAAGTVEKRDRLQSLLSDAIRAEETAESGQKRTRLGLSAVAAGDGYFQASNRLEALRRAISVAERAATDADREVPDIIGLARAAEELAGVDDRLKAIRRLVGSAEVASMDAEKAEEQLETVRTDMEERLGGRCPLCGGEMK